MSPPLADRVWETLGEVIDPELGLPVTDLGLIYDIEIVGGYVNVVMTTTTPICPLGEYLAETARSRIEALPEVGSVRVILANDPPWTIDRMADEARRRLGVGS